MSERIVLGFGNNIDYEIVLNSAVMQTLIVEYDIYNGELSTRKAIKTERDLVVSILGFLKAGVGGERFVASAAPIEQLAKRFDKRVTLGGTSVRAALAMRKLGYTSALHLVTTNDHVRNLLPQGCTYVSSTEQDSLFPHLIVQFAKGISINANDINLIAQHANRIIYHNDHDNIVMNLNTAFETLLSDARVMLISGFNAMQSEVLLKDRLNTISTFIEALPDNALVYYEDAGFYEPSFSRVIYQRLGKQLDIVGLNEDELQDYLARKLDLLNPGQIQKALVELRAIIPSDVIVVHCKYWALAYGGNAYRYADALKGGVTMATTRFCFGDDFTQKQYQTTAQLPPNELGADFSVAINTLLGDEGCCVPVARVEQSNANAVGLGDAFVGGFLPPLVH